MKSPHLLRERGLPRYRAEQLFQWIYKRYVSSIDEITEFSKELRDTLNEVAYISDLTLVKRKKPHGWYGEVPVLPGGRQHY